MNNRIKTVCYCWLDKRFDSKFFVSSWVWYLTPEEFNGRIDWNIVDIKMKMKTLAQILIGEKICIIVYHYNLHLYHWISSLYFYIMNIDLFYYRVNIWDKAW